MISKKNGVFLIQKCESEVCSNKSILGPEAVIRGYLPLFRAYPVQHLQAEGNHVFHIIKFFLLKSQNGVWHHIIRLCYFLRNKKALQSILHSSSCYA